MKKLINSKTALKGILSVIAFFVLAVALLISVVTREEPSRMEPITNFTDVELEKNETCRLETLLPVAKTLDGIDNLRATLIDIAQSLLGNTGDIIVTNARHRQALLNALPPIERVIDGLKTNLSGDFIAQDLREVLHHLGTITGTVTTSDILTTIFSRFCIGK